MFTLSEEVESFNAWVGGSDDAYIWNAQHTMLEDEFGIYDVDEIGRAHVWTPVTLIYLVCRLLLEKKKKKKKEQ